MATDEEIKLQHVLDKGYSLKLVTPAYPLHIRNRGGDLFTIHPNGDVYIRGVLTCDDAEIVRGLRAAFKGVSDGD